MNMKNYKLIIFLGLLVFSILAKAQISTREVPIGFKHNFRREQISEIVMPAVDILKLQAEDKEEVELGLPPRFGFTHTVNFNLLDTGQWHTLENGDKICLLSIVCPKALSINILYDKFWVPEGNNGIDGDAETNPNLSHWTFYWNYELPSNPNDCNYKYSNPSEPLAFSTSGAKILANADTPVSDFALLQLFEDPRIFSNQTPPFFPYYLGLDRTGNSGTSGVGIHHPRGEVNIISDFEVDLGSDLQAGMYLYSLIVDGREVDMKRMILTK